MKRVNYNRIRDRIINMIVEDNLQGVKLLLEEDHIFEYFRNTKHYYIFLTNALVNVSEKCSTYYIENKKNLCDANVDVNNILINSMRSCKWNKSVETYLLCKKLSLQYNIEFNYNPFSLFNRILEPSRVLQEKDGVSDFKRIEYYYDKVINNNILTIEQTNKFIKDLFDNNKDRTIKLQNKIKTYNRNKFIEKLDI